MEDAGLVASASAALTALCAYATVKLREVIKETTSEAAGVIDWPKLRAEVNVLLKARKELEADVEVLRAEVNVLAEFRKELEAEREERTEAERRDLEAKVEELELELRQRELEDSAATRSGVRTQPLRRGK